MSMPQPISLSFKTLLFPLAFAFFELAVYIGNDLVQPAMLSVTQGFGVDPHWAPTSMSAYLLGGALVAAIWGPLSDQLGRRKVFLGGAVFFIVCCIGILFTQSIEQFMLMRVLQGTALTLISAVGFAAIQEHYTETQAVKVMALMANITLLAPLLGPVIGAVMIEHISWHWGFVGIACLSSFAVFGLFKHMPETLAVEQRRKRSLLGILQDFKQVLLHRTFVVLALSGPMLALPVMLWIALSPVFLIEGLGLSSGQYALSQIPVLGGLILGNLTVARWVDRLPLGRTVQIGFPFVLAGVVIMGLGIIWPAYVLWALIVGMSLIAFGEGLSFGVLYRFALMSSPVAKGTVAAAMALLSMTFFSVGIELTKQAYWHWQLLGVWLVSVVGVMAFAYFSYPIVKEKIRQARL